MLMQTFVMIMKIWIRTGIWTKCQRENNNRKQCKNKTRTEQDITWNSFNNFPKISK